jgi:hypothetical protein
MSNMPSSSSVSWRHRSSALFLPGLALVALCGGSALLVWEAVQLTQWPMDSHYYLGKAVSLANGGGFQLPWSGEVDAKFFPGYSVALAPMWWLCAGAPWFWIPFQVLTLWLSAALLWSVAIRVTGQGSVAWVAAAIWASHPVALKWVAVPMAEACATTLALGAAAVYLSGCRAPRVSAALGAGILAGLAVSTRAEMVALALPLALCWLARRRVARPRWIAWGLVGFAVGALPLIAWQISLATEAGNLRFHYLGEIASHGLPSRPWRALHISVIQFAYLPAIPPSSELVYVWQNILVGAVFLALGLSIAGWLGPWGVGAVITLLVYQAAHAVWHFHYERFSVPMVPLMALLWAAAGRVWLLGQGLHPSRGRPWRRAVAWLIAALTLAAGLLYGADVLRNHRESLHLAEPWDPRLLAGVIEIITPPESPVITDLGPTLAYHLDCPVLFDQGLEDFYAPAFPPEETLSVIVDQGVRAVATRRSREQWFADAHIPAERQEAFRVHSGSSQVTLLLVDLEALRR